MTFGICRILRNRNNFIHRFAVEESDLFNEGDGWLVKPLPRKKQKVRPLLPISALPHPESHSPPLLRSNARVVELARAEREIFS